MFYLLLLVVVGVCIWYSVKHAHPLDDDDELGDQ